MNKNIILLKFSVVVLIFCLAVPVVMAQQQTIHRVQPGQTLQSIADTYDVTVNALAITNNIIDPNSLTVGQILVIPLPDYPVQNPATHTVGAGETLAWIAERYNTTVEALLQTNNLVAGVNIYAGQVLQLPATGGPQPPITYSRIHFVETGETLKSIAGLYGTTWQEIATLNHLANPNLISAGQQLLIPSADAPVVVTPVPTPVTPVATAVPSTGGPVVIPSSNRSYVVQVGDTLSQIAARYSVTVESLRLTNNITDNRKIYPGDVLIIPATGGPVVVTPAPVVVNPVYGYHVVQYGETMFAIASAYGVNVYDLAQVNGILNLNQIYVGQYLRIP